MSLQKSVYYLWLGSILLWILLYLYNPEQWSISAILQQYQNSKTQLWTVYCFVSVVRGFFLIPSTPFVIAGGLFFPDQLFLVLVISMIGVMVSAVSLYYFSDYLGFSEYLSGRYPKTYNYLMKKLQGTNATLFITGWAMFPFVPTDLICFVGGILRTPFKNILAGVFIGELMLDIGYVYFGGFLNAYL